MDKLVFAEVATLLPPLVVQGGVTPIDSSYNCDRSQSVVNCTSYLTSVYMCLQLDNEVPVYEYGTFHLPWPVYTIHVS